MEPLHRLRKNNKEMQKQKIGQGYYQAGYGRGFKKSPVVWLINGKAYVKDSKASPYETDLEGYVMVNNFPVSDGGEAFSEVGLISNHMKYEQIQFTPKAPDVNQKTAAALSRERRAKFLELQRALGSFVKRKGLR